MNRSPWLGDKDEIISLLDTYIEDNPYPIYLGSDNEIPF